MNIITSAEGPLFLLSRHGKDVKMSNFPFLEDKKKFLSSSEPRCMVLWNNRNEDWKIGGGSQIYEATFFADFVL